MIDLSGNWTVAHTADGEVEDGAFIFDCPGCGFAHVVRVKGPPPTWTWDGNRAQPTFNPSLLVTIPAYPATSEHSKELPAKRCHSYIRAGQIQFLGDCTHQLAGLTASIQPWPPEES